MKTLTIEWRHLEKDGDTCVRCADTGRSLDAVVAGLAEECRPQGLSIGFRETRLDADRIVESNSVRIDGKPIERILPGASAGENPCVSCCSLTGRETQCRTLTFDGQTWEALPETLLREAVCRVAGCCPPA
jgi:hypothetical protein